jgi:hypothetical protein
MYFQRILYIDEHEASQVLNTYTASADVNFEALLITTMKTTLFWEIMPSSLAQTCKHFGENYSLHLRVGCMFFCNTGTTT